MAPAASRGNVPALEIVGALLTVRQLLWKVAAYTVTAEVRSVH